jgi:pimeloyl-ACP methyl ester carboxylesterase
MIESWGPVTIEIRETAKKMGLAFKERTEARAKKIGNSDKPSSPTFASFDEAARKFHAGTITESPLELSSAKVLVTRNLKPLQGGDSTTSKKLIWSYDNKMKLRGILSPSEEQVLMAIGDIKCPVLMIEGEQGFWKSRYSKKRQELQLRKDTFRDFQLVVVKGAGHYPHMDFSADVASSVNKFILVRLANG